MGYASKLEDEMERNQGAVSRRNRCRVSDAQTESTPTQWDRIATCLGASFDRQRAPGGWTWTGKVALEGDNRLLVESAADQLVKKLEEHGATARRIGPSLGPWRSGAWRCPVDYGGAPLSAFVHMSLPKGVRCAEISNW